MHIAIGCDHRGLEFKQSVLKILTDADHHYQDIGCFTADSVDYPDIAREVAAGVAEGDFDRGVLICGTGIGMCVAANKVKGIRAAVCTDVFHARRARQHNDANIMCLAAEDENSDIAEIIGAFLTTPFEGGRHSRRLDKIREIEG